jgi:integrase
MEAVKEAASMMKQSRRRSNHKPRHLTLPELEQSKTSVLNTLGSLQSRRSYQHAMEEFIAWYCSEPRLALNRIVVLRYRTHLESIALAPATINLRLAAIRRLAYEASDSGLLSPELVAGIRRIKGVKKLGQQVGNWLTTEEAQQLVGAVRTDTLRGKRDAAMLGLLLGCGLRRSEVANLEIGKIQRRDGHWAIVDLVGKAGHVRMVPMPIWVKKAIDSWSCAASIGEGRAIVKMVKSVTGLDAFFAEDVQDLNGLESNILGALRSCAAFITVMHPRGKIVRRNGSEHSRASFGSSRRSPSPLISGGWRSGHFP